MEFLPDGGHAVAWHKSGATDRDDRPPEALSHLKTDYRFSDCACAGSPVRATSSISPTYCKTSKRWPTTSGDRRLMPRSLVLRACQLPQEQIDSVSGKPLEGERPMKIRRGSPSKAQIKSRKPFGNRRLYQRHRSLADILRCGSDVQLYPRKRTCAVQLGMSAKSNSGTSCNSATRTIRSPRQPSQHRRRNCYA